MNEVQLYGVNGGSVMLGLKRGTVELLPHQPLWEDEAAKTITLFMVDKFQF